MKKYLEFDLYTLSYFSCFSGRLMMTPPLRGKSPSCLKLLTRSSGRLQKMWRRRRKCVLGWNVLIAVQHDSFQKTNHDTLLLDVTLSPYVGLCSWREAFAGKTGSPGKRCVWFKATTGNWDEGVLQLLPADLSLMHSLPVPVTDDILLCCCAVQNEKTLAKACEKARTEKKKLQEELAKNQEELLQLSDKLADTEAELESTKQE